MCEDGCQRRGSNRIHASRVAVICEEADELGDHDQRAWCGLGHSQAIAAEKRLR